jgi:hypothetical protein
MKRRAKGRLFAIDERGRTAKSKSLYFGDVASSLVRKSAQFKKAGAGMTEELKLLISHRVGHTIPSAILILKF